MSATNWRKVKNDTGLDMNVPSDLQTGSDTGTFTVIAVTTLPHFKNHKKHGPKDVIQFAVKRELRAITELHEALSYEFPDFGFPDIPRKGAKMSVGARADTLDRFFSYIAQERALCTHPDVLRFLGFDPTKIKVEFDKGLFGDEEDGKAGSTAAVEDEDEVDLFGTASKKDDDFLTSLLHEEEGTLKNKLFAEEDSEDAASPERGSALFGGKSVAHKRFSRGGAAEEMEEREINEDELLSEEAKELLRIGRDEDLDNIIAVASEKRKQATEAPLTKTPSQPSATGRKKSSLFDDEDEGLFGAIAAKTEKMGAGDILSYLAQNSAAGDEEEEEEDDFLK